MRQLFGIKIEKGIPIPTKKGKPGFWTAIFDQMEEGESILVSKKEAGTIISSIYRRRKAYRITSYTVGKDKVRVWKIEARGSK